ncbi:hypothetical protein BDV96DRAFT_98859 [Lophiotrema nucula]|uniref:Uncharacterized protein n=1 Tax=Lophiotrema nucula TaxID=690887 RepID=A0A6A5Z5T9_9PLEO|nr:hypothetical protein BDV96DRAFT_98859 [Lophiotrema nucula]
MRIACSTCELLACTVTVMVRSGRQVISLGISPAVISDVASSRRTTILHIHTTSVRANDDLVSRCKASHLAGVERGEEKVPFASMVANAGKPGQEPNHTIIHPSNAKANSLGNPHENFLRQVLLSSVQSDSPSRIQHHVLLTNGTPFASNFVGPSHHGASK